MSQAQHTKKSLERGLRLHQSGKLDEAGLIYRQVLDQNPGNADALHFLGLIAQQKGDAALAIDLISDAIEIEEPRPTFHFNLAAARLAAGDAAGALNSYRRAAELKPDFDDAHYSIGALLGRSGRAVSELLPWGMVAIDGIEVDALSESGAIEVGVAIEAVAAQGTALVVRRREADGSKPKGGHTPESRRPAPAESAPAENAAPEGDSALSPTLEAFEFEGLEPPEA